MLVGRTARSAWLDPVNDGLWVLCRLPGFARCVRLLLNDRPGGTEMGQLTTVEAANWMALYLATGIRSEEHTSELQSLMRISYAVFCLKKKKITKEQQIR